jgi:hypothetical protein
VLLLSRMLSFLCCKTAWHLLPTRLFPFANLLSALKLMPAAQFSVIRSSSSLLENPKIAGVQRLKNDSAEVVVDSPSSSAWLSLSSDSPLLLGSRLTAVPTFGVRWSWRGGFLVDRLATRSVVRTRRAKGSSAGSVVACWSSLACLLPAREIADG